jgi:hypothetical protein
MLRTMDRPTQASGHLAATGLRRVEDLLDAVHVAGEAGHDDASRGGPEDRLDGRGELPLGRGEARDLGVGGVGEEERDTFLTQPGESPQVGDPTVEGELVHLEVAGVQQHPRVGPHRHGQAVGDRVVDGDELAVERVQVDPAPRLDLDGLGTDAELLELRLDEGQGQARTHHGDAGPFAEQVGDSPDVVLVAVREDDRRDPVQAVPDPGEVGQDHVDPRLVLLGEEHPAVDDQQSPPVLEDRHVAADLPQAAEGHDSKSCGVQVGQGGAGHRWGQGEAFSSVV